MPLGEVDLDTILCHEEARVVARDNTVSFGRQIVCRSRGSRAGCSCAGLAVTVRQHLDGGYSITRGAQRLGTFGPDGQLVDAVAPVDGRTRRPPTTALGPARDVRGPFHRAHRRIFRESGQITCQTKADRSLANNTPVTARDRASFRSETSTDSEESA